MQRAGWVKLKDPNQPTWRTEYIQFPVADRKRIATSQDSKTALAIDRELGGDVDLQRHLQWLPSHIPFGTFVTHMERDLHRHIEFTGDQRIWCWLLLLPDGTTREIFPEMYDAKLREFHEFRHDDGFVWLLFRGEMIQDPALTHQQ